MRSTRAWAVAAAVVLVVGGVLVAVRPHTEVVAAGTWRGDGTGTTSSAAATPDRVLWSVRRIGAASFGQFRPTFTSPVTVVDDVAVGWTWGYATGVDTVTGRTRWERYVGSVGLTPHHDTVLAPMGPGVVAIDARTGQDRQWIATGDGRTPTSLYAATDEVLLVGVEADAGRPGVAAYGWDGRVLWAVPGAFPTVWQDGGRLRVVLNADDGTGSRSEVDPVSGEPLRGLGDAQVWTQGGSGGWVLSSLDGDATPVTWLDGDRTYRIPEPLLDAQFIHASGDTAVVLGLVGRPVRPPAGSSAAVVIEGPTGRITPVTLDAGFGTPIASRADGIVVVSGSLVRLVQVTTAGATTRWEEGITGGETVQVVGDLVTQFTPQRWRAWDADTGALRLDITPQDLPAPTTDAQTQPYVRGDGFVLDAADSLTQVLDPIAGDRVDVRNSVHVATTPLGEVVHRRREVSLIGSSSGVGWTIAVDGLNGTQDVVVLGDTVVVARDGSEAGGIEAFALADGASRGRIDPGVGRVGALHVVGDAVLVTGKGVALVDLTAGGPVARWHTEDAPSPYEAWTPVLHDGVITLVGATSAVDHDVRTGARGPLRRLPDVLAAVVAYRGGTVYGVSGRHAVAFDARTLDEIWSTDVGARISSAPTLAGDRLYVGTEGGDVVMLDLAGAVIDRFGTGTSGPIVGAPTVANGLVLVFADSGRQLVALGGS